MQSPTSPTTAFIPPHELRARREYLGLTYDAFATALGVRSDTARRWETGRDRIPGRVPQEIAELEAVTASWVTRLQEIEWGIHRDGEPFLDFPDCPETDSDARDLAGLPWATARWWRHCAARSMAT